MKTLTRKEWIKRLKPYWKDLELLQNDFYIKVNKLEKIMKEKINKDIEFAWVEGDIVGIGSYPTKTLKLIHESELR